MVFIVRQNISIKEEEEKTFTGAHTIFLTTFFGKKRDFQHTPHAAGRRESEIREKSTVVTFNALSCN